MASHERYYVPEQSPWPVIASLGLLCGFAGAGLWLNALKAGREGFGGPLLLLCGALLLAWVLSGWFGHVIRESRAGLYSAQMDRSFRWGMRWFIFSEVMFFAALFGALFYVRVFVGPWLDGAGDKGVSAMLWPDFAFAWPLLENPDPARYPGPSGVIDPWQLPLLNTVLLLASSLTLGLAHHALRRDARRSLGLWLALTVLLGVAFLILQAVEYRHAWHALGLTPGSGIYAATFYLLTGFHGLHVSLGAFILAVMLVRVLRGHFDARQHFGFEAAAWYWHFVDAVWVGLFLFVYVF